MKTKLWMLSAAAAGAAVTAFLAFPPSGFAADHGDAPSLAITKAADINDVYAWMSSDAQKVNLAMTVVPFAATGEGFSPNIQYVFHVNRMAQFGATSSTETLIICEFTNASNARCWLGADTYVAGNFTNVNGVSSADGRLKVFAGPRNDPFFFHLSGFRAGAESIQTALTGAYPPGGTGCPSNPTLTAEVRGELTGSPVDFFAGFSVYAIVMEVDKTAFAGTGDIIGVWASTHTKPAS